MLPAALVGIVLAFAPIVRSQSCGFSGGFAARFPAGCPTDFPVSCGTSTQPKCCPSGFECTDGKYCCESGEDCSAESEEHPQCPDASWSVWAYNTNGSLGWCCDSGYYGWSYLDNTGVGCEQNGVSIDTATSHTAFVVTAAALTCSSTSTSTTSSATTTSTTIAALTTSASTSSTGTASPSSTTSSATSTGTADGTTTVVEAKSTGLSSGAIAGIAVGGAAILALLALAGWWFGRRSKRNKAAATAHPMASAELYQDGGAGTAFKPYKDGAAVSESPVPAYAPAQIHEIGQQEEHAGRYEMPGNNTWR